MTKPAFRSIPGPIGADDEALSKLSDSLGMPALVRSGSERPIAGAELHQDGPKPEPRSSPSSKTPAAKKPTPASIVKLSVDVPSYVVDAIRLRAAKERSTSRQIVLLGLQGLGFEIDAADLIADGRRPEGKRRR